MYECFFLSFDAILEISGANYLKIPDFIVKSNGIFEICAMNNPEYQVKNHSAYEMKFNVCILVIVAR